MPNIKISTVLMTVKYTIEYSHSERQWCTVFTFFPPITITGVRFVILSILCFNITELTILHFTDSGLIYYNMNSKQDRDYDIVLFYPWMLRTLHSN